MTSGRVGLEVEGLRELRQSFGKAGRKKELDRGLRDAHKKIAKDTESASKAAAATGTAQQARMIRALLGKGETEASVLSIKRSSAAPFGLGAFMGAIRWKQFPAWVGESWDIEAGKGPYVVAATIARQLPQIRESYADGIDDTLRHLGLNMS